MITVPEFTETRRLGGEKKVEQIRATGAKVLTTTCENCKSKIEDLNEHYNVGISIEGVVNAAARALIYKK